jgi:heptosyltransferase-2
MAKKNFLSNILYKIFQKLFGTVEDKDLSLSNPQKFLIVRQHNQLGDLLAGVSLFRAIKETYPASSITIILSPDNYHGLVKNRFIDKIFIFDKKKLLNPLYVIRLVTLLRSGYDSAIVPVVVSISFTSNFLAGLSNSRVKIGAASLNGIVNESAFFFNRRIKLDWRKHPDSNVSERSLDIVRPFGITTSDYRVEINFTEEDIEVARLFKEQIGLSDKEYIIGFHVGAGKPSNRWSLDKYLLLMRRLKEIYLIQFYLTGSNSDREEIQYLKSRAEFKLYEFLNKPIPEVAALISLSDLFISNDTGIMHVAGSTSTPQISIFGPTNPFNWAPIGNNKYFIRKSELIDDVSVQDVFELCKMILPFNKEEYHVR